MEKGLVQKACVSGASLGIMCVVHISVALFPTKQTGEGPANAVVRN